MKWALTTLASVCESVRYGYTASASADECGPKFLRITDIVPESLDWETVPYCEIDEPNKEKFALDVGDIVVARTGATVGYAKLIREPVSAVFASYLVRFRVDQSKAEPAFIGLIIESHLYKSFVQSRIGGAAQPNASAPVLGSFEFKLPSRHSQSRIASILSNYDDLIENNRRRMALLEDAARQVYQEWFVRLRFPGYEHTRIVDGVPEGWEKVSVPDIIVVNPKEKVEKGKTIWYVPMASLSEVGMTVDSSYFESRTEHTAVKFCKEDVLLARITPCLENGKTAFVHFLEENEVACGSTEFIVLRGNRISPYFTYCLARSYNFRENAIKSMVGSSGRQRVQTSCFEKFVMGLPPRALLTQFDETAKGCFEQISNLTKQNQKLRTARDLLLPKLMSGEIAV